ncbi:MAG: type II methionyl aminopeptidase [Nanoarchaeota archaeon]
MNEKEIEKIIEAGKIASDVRNFAKTIIKAGMPLLEIAQIIENKIRELKGKPAFPVNLSINEIAAHYTPTYNDENLASGLLKVDLGVQIGGYISDTAFSLDLENSQENKDLIKAAEHAVNEGTKTIQKNSQTSKIGESIQKTIESKDFSPITNLSGHSMEEYKLHSGINIPNIDDKTNTKIKEGLYAIEPFVTLNSASGKVYDGKPSGIYELINEKTTRSSIAREVLEIIKKDYKTLPFCSRWLVNQIGTKALIGLKQLEEQEIIKQFPQLIESTGQKISQAEHTVLITKDKKIITTQ